MGEAQMSFIGKFHPLLVHFPIALVLAAAAAELVVIATLRQGWRTVAVANIHAGAAMGVVTAITGWLFASSPVVDAGTSLEWHRWLGMAGAMGAIGAAILSSRLHVSSQRSALVYRVTLFVTAFLVAITGHLGGTLVWGARFFQP
jgi:uncharacterized membrane protein